MASVQEPRATSPLPPAERHAYENRILLRPTDHVVVDRQPEHWTVKKLRALNEHERTMTARTADARSDGLQFHMPRAVMLTPVIGGRQLLDIVGPAYAYAFDCDESDTGAADGARCQLAPIPFYRRAQDGHCARARVARMRAATANGSAPANGSARKDHVVAGE